MQQPIEEPISTSGADAGRLRSGEARRALRSWAAVEISFLVRVGGSGSEGGTLKRS